MTNPDLITLDEVRGLVDGKRAYGPARKQIKRLDLANMAKAYAPGGETNALMVLLDTTSDPKWMADFLKYGAPVLWLSHKHETVLFRVLSVESLQRFVLDCPIGKSKTEDITERLRVWTARHAIMSEMLLDHPLAADLVERTDFNGRTAVDCLLQERDKVLERLKRISQLPEHDIDRVMEAFGRVAAECRASVLRHSLKSSLNSIELTPSGRRM